MTYPAYNFSVLDDAGNIVTDVSVEVRREAPGQPLVQVYADREGASPLGNPFTSAAGKGRFHVETGGAFQIKATKGAETWTLRYVGISRGQESDLTGLVPAGDWVSVSPANEYSIGEWVQYQGRAFASNIDGNTATPPTSDASDDNWTWLPLPSVDGVQIDEEGTFAGRAAFDDEDTGFIYASTDGDQSVSPAITTSVLFRKNSPASADWGEAIPFQGHEGPSGSVGTSGTPAAGEIAVFVNATTIEGTDNPQVQGETLIRSPDVHRVVLLADQAAYDALVGSPFGGDENTLYLVPDEE